MASKPIPLHSGDDQAPTVAADPQFIVGDIGCRIEQAQAALRLASDSIHELFEGKFGDITPEQQRHLYNGWLALVVVLRDLEQTGALTEAAEAAIIRDRKA